MVVCGFVVNLEKLSKLHYCKSGYFHMVCRVSTDNSTLFQETESVIFCDDYVQYDNSLLFFEALIDCWLYSVVHNVLVDSCKII
jgi:hypothetical protein